MTKRDYGILWAGYGTYISYAIYEMANGKYKCWKCRHHWSDIYDKYRSDFDGNSAMRERVITKSARDGIDKVLNNYREAIEWARNNR